MRARMAPERHCAVRRQRGAIGRFIAAAANAGAILAVSLYTSHITGIVSSLTGIRILLSAVPVSDDLLDIGAQDGAV